MAARKGRCLKWSKGRSRCLKRAKSKAKGRRKSGTKGKKCVRKKRTRAGMRCAKYR